MVDELGDDLAWFVAHPKRRFRARPATDAEKTLIDFGAFDPVIALLHLDECGKLVRIVCKTAPQKVGQSSSWPESQCRNKYLYRLSDAQRIAPKKVKAAR